MKVTLIHNPDAGGANPRQADDLVALIREAGHDARVQSSRESHWHDALRERVDLVAVAGGDGTVGEVAKRLAGSRTPIAVLPMGTANNIAAALGVSHLALDEWIFAWNNARRMKFDLGVARGPWGMAPFIEGVGMGFFTDTMARLEAEGDCRLGYLGETDEKLASVLEILRRRLESCASHEMKITADGRDLSGRYILLEAMNIHCIGPNFSLAPPADPGDGMLDLVVATHDERERIHKYLSDCIERKSNYPGLKLHKVERLRIECAGLSIHIDDDLWPQEGPPPEHAITVDLALNSGQVELLAPE